MVLRVGVIGCGAIGTEICKAINEDKRMALKLLIDRNPGRIERLCSDLNVKPIIKHDSSGFEDIVKDVDLVIECASQSAVREFIIPALKKGKEVMILSVGALIDPEFFGEMRKIASEKGCKVYIPPGAIAGLDGLRSARIGEIYAIRLTTRKPPSGFEGNEYVERKDIDLRSLKREKVLFRGDVEDAVKHFPENVNVAASLSIASQMKEAVTIVADPGVEENIHEIEVEGEIGRIFTRVENVPSPSNPKTSRLAALSAVATLKEILEPIRVGM